MSRVFKRIDCKSARNLAIFWAVHRDGRTQDEVAAQYGITQQRVSAIIGEAAKFVALAPSEEYEKIPQMGQLQFAYRIQLEKLKQRRRNVALAFEKSMEGSSCVKTFESGKEMLGEGAKGSFRQWKKEGIGKTQHGDWRLDRQLGLIDREIIDSTVELYGRDWLGWDQLEKAGMKPRRKRRKRKSNDELQMSKEARNSKDEARDNAPMSAEPAAVVDRVACLTAGARACGGPTELADSVVTSSEPQHALPDGVGHGTPVVAAAVPPSVLVPLPSCESAIAPAKPVATRPPVAAETVIRAAKFGSDPPPPGSYRFNSKPVWITGPDPKEVLSKDVQKMTYEEYQQYKEDVKSMWLMGSYPLGDWLEVPDAHPEWATS